jgi:exodeoxyribonuclease III
MSTPFRVLTYNIRDGGRGRVDLIVRVIEPTGADLVLLNEADDPDIVGEIGRRLELEHIWARGSGAKHTALMSRRPIRQWRVYNRRPITQSLLQAQIAAWPDTALNIYGVHLLPYFMLWPYELARWRTVRSIVQLTRVHRNEPHLLLGDFNAVLPSEQADLGAFSTRIRRLASWQGNRFLRLALRPILHAGYVDAFRSLHPHEAGLTWMPQHPTARLDYIFADRKMAACLRACRVVTAFPAEHASDHYPLLAEFDLDGLQKGC